MTTRRPSTPCALRAVEEPDATVGPEALLWPRLWARQIDSVICLGLSLGLVVALGATSLLRAPNALVALFFWPTLVALLQLCYESVLLSAFGTTVGKALLGLRVETQFGRRLEFARACGRSAGVWLNGSYAYVLFPVATLLAWARAQRELRTQGSTSWDKSWETEVVGGPVPFWRLSAAAVLVIGALGIVVALQVNGNRRARSGETLAPLHQSSGAIEASSVAPPRAADTNSAAPRHAPSSIPEAARVKAGSEGPIAVFQPNAVQKSFDIKTPPGRPDVNKSAEDLALWAERTYPYFARDGAERQAMFAWMIEGTRAGLQRNHALALGIDTVVSGIEGGRGVCWPTPTTRGREAKEARQDADSVELGIRCEH